MSQSHEDLPSELFDAMAIVESAAVTMEWNENDARWMANLHRRRP